MFDEERPKTSSSTHQIGQDLSLLAITEIDERIAMLEAEIERLRVARAAKVKTQAAADLLFKR
jgi:uncharacterized small protein (DUF1192 family)